MKIGRVRGSGAALMWALGAGLAAQLGWSAAASAQQVPVVEAAPARADEREVRFEAWKFRFAVPKDWKVQSDQGIAIASSPDEKVLMITVLLNDTAEIPQALKQIDELIVVTDVKFGKPETVVQGLIPLQFLPGAGRVQPSGAAVEILSVTANVLKKPVVSMFYVHKDAVGRHMPSVTHVIRTFGVLLSPEEAKAMEKTLEDAKRGKPPAP